MFAVPKDKQAENEDLCKRCAKEVSRPGSV